MIRRKRLPNIWGPGRLAGKHRRSTSLLGIGTAVGYLASAGRLGALQPAGRAQPTQCVLPGHWPGTMTPSACRERAAGRQREGCVGRDDLTVVLKAASEPLKDKILGMSADDRKALTGYMEWLGPMRLVEVEGEAVQVRILSKFDGPDDVYV